MLKINKKIDYVVNHRIYVGTTGAFALGIAAESPHPPAGGEDLQRIARPQGTPKNCNLALKNNMNLKGFNKKGIY
ncbi:MAG TPA: hypothetical protein VN922_11525 [Bacteroidia bacterium]|nr:hypothetical protein [Bacteroidia bacterium]